MYQTVRIDCQYTLSRVRVSVRPSDFFMRERGKYVRKEEEREGWKEGGRGMDGERE